MKVDWYLIDTVLLDMDGTILDLKFDNYFWQEYVPSNFARDNLISIESAKAILKPLFKDKEGSLDWYCLDYWSKELKLDIAGLKSELSEQILYLPYAFDFLIRLQQSHRKVFLVTNAHRASLSLKINKTNFDNYFDEIVSSHDYGVPKEHIGFWDQLNKNHVFDKDRAILIDDSFSVLNSARNFGIKHLLSVSKPDSNLPLRLSTDFDCIIDFRELMVGL